MAEMSKIKEKKKERKNRGAAVFHSARPQLKLLRLIGIMILILTLETSVLTGSAAETALAAETSPDTGPVPGDGRPEYYLPLLEGKRIALFSNQSGIAGNKTETAGDQSMAGGSGAGTGGSQAEPDGENMERDDVYPAKDRIPFGKNADGSDVIYGEHILDVLLRQDINVTMVFSPEHGFRGTSDAGSQVGDSVDEKTGVPIHSLYGGGSMSPTDEELDRFDVLVVDIQDVGLRFYTYYISMYYLMDACAAAGKEVVILDRPNPNGFYVDGPVLKDEFISGVGLLPIPVVHGMTLGELARMINGEGWLSAGKDACRLTVVPCDRYTHQTLAELIRRPSPNLKDMRAVYLYASTCCFENTLFSVGRGTEYPFEAYGSPYAEEQYFQEDTSGPEDLSESEDSSEPEDLSEQEEPSEREDSLKSAGIPFSFVPVSMEGADSPPFEGQTCYGRDLRQIPLTQILSDHINLHYLLDAYNALRLSRPDLSFFGSPDKAGRYWIDYLFGTDEVRHMIESGCSAEQISESWQEDVERFREQRKPYLLYEE